MANTIHVDVVSAEEQIFSGDAEFVVLPGISGEISRTGSAATTPPEMNAHRTRPRVTA